MQNLSTDELVFRQRIGGAIPDCNFPGMIGSIRTDPSTKNLPKTSVAVEGYGMLLTFGWLDDRTLLPTNYTVQYWHDYQNTDMYIRHYDVLEHRQWLPWKRVNITTI